MSPQQLAEGYRAAAGPQGAGAALLPVRVRTEDGREADALLAPDSPPSRLTLVAGRSLLGQKARVAALGPGGGEHIVWHVRVLSAFPVGEGLYEHGAMLLGPGAG